MTKKTENELKEYLSIKAKVGDDPKNFAYVPDKDHVTTWKLDISDFIHISGAITAVRDWAFEGQPLDIPKDARSGIISKIRGAISRNVDDKDKRQQLLDRVKEELGGKASKAMNSVMVALMVPSPDASVLNKATAGAGLIAQPADELHLTLAILGDADALGDQRTTITQVVQNFASGCGPIVGSISGVGRFDITDNVGASAIYASFDSGSLGEFRESLIDALQAQGIQNASLHGFTPHITLCYIASDAPTPDIELPTGMVIQFPAVCVCWGEEETDCPFGSGDMMPMASRSTARSVPAELNFGELDGAPEVPTTAIKANPDNPDRFQGHLVLWGDSARKDLTGEYFDQHSDLGLDLHVNPELPKVRIPTLYHHALDKVMKTGLVGMIDTAVPDDIGLWVEGEYNKRLKYLQHIKDLVNKGALSFSSGSVPHWVRRAKDGHLERWPIVEASMTPMPAEPRGTDISHVMTTKHLVQAAAIKSAYRLLNIPTTGLDDEEAEQDASAGADKEIGSAGNASPSAAKTAVVEPTIKLITHEGNNMSLTLTQEQLAAQIAEAVKKARDEEKQREKEVQDAEIARQTAIKAEVDRLVAEKIADYEKSQKPRRTLPVPAEGGDGKPAVKTQAVVLENRRFAGMNSDDLSFLLQCSEAYARGARFRIAMSGPGHREDLAPAMKIGLSLIEEIEKDQDRKFEREVAAKAIREVNRKERVSSVIDYLPYKSLDDVYANDLDEATVKAYLEDREKAIKANELDSSGQSGFGADWVNQLWANTIWSRVRIANPIAQNMNVIDMPTNPFNLPIETTDPTVYYVAEGTDATQLVYGSGNTMTLSKVASDKKVLTAVKLGTRIGFSNELNEDSIIPIVPIYRHQAQRSLANFVDDTVLNGDTATGASTNINLIDGTPATGTSYLALNGLRKYCLITNTGQLNDFGNGAPTVPLIRGTIKLLNKHYAVDIANLRLITTVETYFKMKSMPEYATYLNVGQPAANVTGLLPGGDQNQVGDVAMPVGNIDGVPVYVSAQFGLTKSGAIGSNGGEISGTPANNVAGGVVVYHKSRCYLGYRRRIAVDLLQMGALSDTYQLWGTVRLALAIFDTSSIALGYDIAV